MTMRAILIFLHLGGLLLLTAGVGASVACKMMAVRTRSAAAVITLLEAASLAVRRTVVWGSVLIVGAGIGLVSISKGAFRYEEPWISGAIILLILSSALGSVLHAPRSRKSRAIAQRLIDNNEEVSDELRAVIRSGWWVSALDTVLLLGMVALMVFKPTFGM